MTLTTNTIGRPQMLRVGDLARATGKTVRAIHLYEELGLLKPNTRSSGGYRLYGAVAVERVRWIELLQGLGFSLHEMADVLRQWWSADRGPEAMANLRGLFERKLEETREAVRRHQALEQELIESLRYLETCRECDEPGPVRTCVHCQHDHGAGTEPALVAGLKSTREAARPSRPPFVRVEEIDR